jgi:hypothetical protein
LRPALPAGREDQNAVYRIASHKFKVGETVGFAPSRRSMNTQSSTCKVIRLLPADGGENLYRVKCASEPFERIARESELN